MGKGEGHQTGRAGLSADSWFPLIALALLAAAASLSSRLAVLTAISGSVAAEPLSDRPHPDWQESLAQHLVHGMPRFNEVVFLHRASRSLIITDIAMNFGPDSGWLLKLVMSLNGGVGRFGPTGFCKSMMKDRAAVRASLDTILTWDFDRIIVGHGRNVETDGRRVFREAFAFLP